MPVKWVIILTSAWKRYLRQEVDVENIFWLKCELPFQKKNQSTSVTNLEHVSIPKNISAEKYVVKHTLLTP